VRGLISRAAALALAATVALGAAAVPCAAGDAAASKGNALTRLSPGSRQMLATATPARTRRQQAGAPSSPGSFFKSTRGKITLALMGVGAGYTVYSIHHDRLPVKSPIR
jgi:hypothetical protein